MEELWFMPPGEAIDLNGTFNFAILSTRAKMEVKRKTMTMCRVLGDHDERRVVLFNRLLKFMCLETGKVNKMLQSRLDALRMSVHCLYDIALKDVSDRKMVILQLLKS